MSCAEFADLAAELALGTLPGDRRAAALLHADSCPSCRALLQGLSLTSDALLQLAPTAEPPLGFEDRVLATIRAGVRPARRSRWRIATVGAAAAIAIGFGVGRMTNGGTEPTVSAPRGISVATLVSGNQWRGEMVVGPGHPAWLFVNVNDLGPISKVGCQVTLADGRTVSVGTFPLDHGYGGWTVALRVAPEQIRSAELLRADGSTILTAKFAS
ncbi:MAG: anti-sigma factor family protein [Acidimicrobiales bacterium]